MAKWVKRFLSLAAVCGAVAGVVYYFKKQSSDQDDEFADDFEDEDFDLDSDLKPVSDREYVPLNPKPEETDLSLIHISFSSISLTGRSFCTLIGIIDSPSFH